MSTSSAGPPDGAPGGLPRPPIPEQVPEQVPELAPEQVPELVGETVHDVVDDGWWQGFFEQDYQWLFADAITPEETERAVNDLVALVGLEPGWRVLDAPGGAGRHAVPLALLGCHVTMVDRSPALLAQARVQASGQPRLRVVDADLRRPLELDPGGDHGPPFDLVANLFNSLGYFATAAEDRAVLTTLASQVAPGGVLVLEVANPVDARAGKSREVTRLHDATVRAHRRWDPATRRLAIHYRVEPDDGGPVRTTGTLQRLWEADELAAALAAAGLDVIDVHGDLDGRPLDDDTDWLVVVARRS